MSLWEEVKKNVVELYSVTSDKTTEMAKVGSRRWDKFGISRDIERQFSELGNLVYTGLQEGRKDILEEEAVAVLMARIGSLEEELRRKEEEISRIQKEHRERKAAEAAAGGTAAQADDEDAAAEEGGQAAPDVIIKDPALETGKDESAILVEPSEGEAPAEEPAADEEDRSRND
jgi:hypothetical protein